MKFACWPRLRRRLRPVVSEARTLDRFIAPAQERLWALARNLWWCWDHDTSSLFRDLDPVRWRQLNHNPISLLSEIPLARNGTPRPGTGAAQPDQLRLSPPARISRRRTVPGEHDTPAFCGPVRWRIFPPNSVCTYRFRNIPAAWACWPATTSRARRTWAFRSSGSDLFYGQGYFRQRLDRNGWQQEEYIQTDVSKLPMEAAIGTNGEPVTVQIETRGGAIRAKVWRMKVGRCDLLLLDSNVEGNQPEDRELTSRLYGGDSRIRIRQELLLGVGGFRALRAMGITPGVLHLNEGHSGFAVLEAIRSRMQDEGLDFRSGGALECRAKWCLRRTLRCPPVTTVSTRI